MSRPLDVKAKESARRRGVWSSGIRKLCGLLVLLPLVASAFDIYQLPMSSNSTAQPNVMLLIDNSGSMNNAIWADGFDVKVNYTDWSNSGSYWDPNDGNVHLSDLDSQRGSCGSGFVRGKNGATTKCLKLPDPVGSRDTRYDGNYLNYLFSTYANNTDLTAGQIPSDYRMKVARTVAKDIIDNTTGIRFGVSDYYGPSSNNLAHGATILQSCDDGTPAHINAMETAIAGLSASTNTPLAEAFYEITRYFRGLSSYYHGSGTTYTSPVQYRCQLNFVIAITDGFPTYDTTFPTNDPADVADTTRALPNWDGLAPATTQSQYPLFPQYSDGFKPSGSEADEGYSLYLDDLAKFGYGLDLKTTGSDLNGQPWGSASDAVPTPPAPDYRIQRIQTYTVGFATSNQMLADAAQYGHGQYFTANNAADLTEALQTTLLDIQTQAVSASSVALNSTRLDTNLLIYQGRFNSVDWSGDLQAFSVTSGVVDTTKLWSASEHVPVPASRKIFTMKQATTPRNAVVAAWSNISTAQKKALGNDSAVLAYLLGDRSKEKQNGGNYRDRSTVLGDIVNSDPQFVGQADFGYERLPGAEGSSYQTFRTSSTYTGRPPMVYVGANDGMLHAFDGRTTNNGTELFAYIPLPTYPYLKQLTSPSYVHHFFVDGSPGFGDAYINTGSGAAWRTVLVGTLGAGGRGVFALDVTDPVNFAANKVLWEYVNIADPGTYSPNMSQVDPAPTTPTTAADLGYTYGQASVVRLANGKWGALVGNGYNSTNNHAVLYILDLTDGSVIRKIDTGVGSATSPNGLSSPLPVDTNNDRITDAIYAGDMQGNLWKFDVSATSANSWGVAFSGSPLIVAKDSVGTVQPITTKPEATLNPGGDIVVLFGTGKYFEEVDHRNVAPQQTQTFYGVFDRGAAITGSRSSLLQQSVILTIPSTDTSNNPSAGTTNPVDLRVTSNLALTTSNNGWYLDLPDQGERQVSRPQVNGGRVIFTTVVPNGLPCSAGGHSWLMELDAFDGSRLDNSFDLNKDTHFTSLDYVALPDGTLVAVSGEKIGISKTPGLAGDGTILGKFVGQESGEIYKENNQDGVNNGRQSWRQIR